MNIPKELASIEKRLDRAGISVSQFLKRAGVNDAQWTRWKKRGQVPLMTTWEKIERAIARLST